ncbi:Hypothetical protein CINCED_3A003261 [Cinara cedri]|uniref:Uncharacterized protein n=1 Tax=Cinara cedri TaxID=506608 RepID=A0A5E4MPW7_9HEMI|nr:Hypothetical protein CINCED_3A003261 [Cinara cedri]
MLSKNPNVIIIQELNAPGVCVWAGICSYTIIGPYFHDGNGPKYLKMLEEVKIELVNNDIFRDKRIICIWGVIKDRVYKTPIQNLIHLKRRIEEEFQILNIDYSYLYNATNAVKKCCGAVIEAGGHHFEHLL